MSWIELKVIALWGLVWILFLVMGAILCLTDYGLYKVYESEIIQRLFLTFLFTCGLVTIKESIRWSVCW